MDPMTPTTSTLTPAIGHIAEMAAGLKRSKGLGSDDGEELRRRKEQRDVVRWVLGAEGRIRGMVDGGEEDQARAEWERVEGVLEQWEGVKGVEAVREACLGALGNSSEG